MFRHSSIVHPIGYISLRLARDNSSVLQTSGRLYPRIWAKFEEVREFEGAQHLLSMRLPFLSKQIVGSEPLAAAPDGRRSEVMSYVHRPDLVTRTIDGEVVILDQSAGTVHHLNATASHIWSECDGTRSAA